VLVDEVEFMAGAVVATEEEVDVAVDDLASFVVF